MTNEELAHHDVSLEFSLSELRVYPMLNGIRKAGPFVDMQQAIEWLHSVSVREFYDSEYLVD